MTPRRGQTGVYGWSGPAGGELEDLVATRRLRWTNPYQERSPAPGSDSAHSVREISRDDLDVVFQPIVSLSDGKLFANEALVRCRWEEYRNPPALFEAAVEQQAIGRLGRSIREVTFERCGTTPVFVNVHPDELSSRWLVRPDDPLNLHEHPIYLEVTESATFQYYELCMGVLKEICARTGSRLVIDDLGAGYSNLKRVLDLEPAVVKLDLALIRGIDRSKRQQTLARHLVQLFNELGSTVVGEGIETLDELKALRDTGAEYGQGYLLARPAFPIPSPVWPLRPSRRIQAPSSERSRRPGAR